MLTEEEELELLELEEAEAKAKATPVTPTETPQPEQKPGYLERVQNTANELALKAGESVKKEPSTLNKIVAPVKQFTGTMAAQLNESLPYRAIGKVAEPIIGAVSKAMPGTTAALGTLGKFYNKNAPESVKNIAGSIGDVSQMVPGVGALGKAIPKTAGFAAEKTGKSLTGMGKSVISSDAKIRDSVAKLAGKTPLEGVKKITDDIAKYEVESATGGFSGISTKAQKRINQEMQRGEQAISDFAAKNPGAAVDVDYTFLQLADDLAGGKEKSIFLNEDKAADLAIQIHSSLEKRGLTGLQPVSKLPEIKKAIDDGMNLFKKGSQQIELDPLPSKVGELSYLRLKNELEQHVPEIAESNKAVHDLITVKTAMEAAQKLAGNRNKLGITDLALIFGGPSLAANMGVSGGAMLAGIPGVALAGKKLAGDARGASAMIKSGRGFQKIGKYLK